jgi:hypothetical protein
MTAPAVGGHALESAEEALHAGEGVHVIGIGSIDDRYRMDAKLPVPEPIRAASSMHADHNPGEMMGEPGNLISVPLQGGSVMIILTLQSVHRHDKEAAWHPPACLMV